MEKSIAFVVLTCDAYSDLWPMYLHFISKNWADCPYDKYFVTNYKSIDDSSFNCMKIGKDESWSDNLLKVLAQLKSDYDYVLVTLEDVPIVQKVDQKRLNHMVKLFVEIDANFLSCTNIPKETHKFNSSFGIIEKGSIYRPTCEYSLWKISVLEKLLVKGENAWEFERFGAVRSDKHDKFYVVYKNIFFTCHTVVKGKWIRSGLRKIIQLGFIPDIQKRKIFSWREELFYHLYGIIFNIFHRTIFVPWQLRRKIVFKFKGYS
jgi:hypothetical protein